MNEGVTLRPPPVCTGRGGRYFFARSEKRLRSVQPCVNSTRLGASSRAHRLTAWFDKKRFRLVERCRTFPGPAGSHSRSCTRERCRTFPGPAGSFADRGFSIALAGCGCRCATPSSWTGSLSQLATQGDTLSSVLFLMGYLACRRSWKIDAISLAYLPSRAVGVAAPPSFFGSPAHWRPPASQMFACSQLKSFHRLCAVLVLIAIYRFSAWAHPGPCGQALCVCTQDALWYCTCPLYPAVSCSMSDFFMAFHVPLVSGISCSMSASPEEYKKI